MGWFNGCVLYVLLWWVSLFAVLPWGVRATAAPHEVSGWRGTPDRAHLIRTVIATSVVALVLWLGAYALISSPNLSFRHGWLAMQPHN
jgi:predicted secreted protein